MKKSNFLCLSFLLIGALVGCDEENNIKDNTIEPNNQTNEKTNNTSSDQNSSDDITSITEDGLTIKSTSDAIKNVKYDTTRKEFLIVNKEEQTEYIAEGITTSRIRFGAASTESAVLILNGTTFTSNTGIAPIFWEAENKKLELKVQKGTENTLSTTLEDVPVIQSENNLDIGGGGVLNITADKSTTVKCDKLCLKGTGTYNVTSKSKNGFKVNSLECKEKATFVCNITAEKAGIIADGKAEKSKGYINLLSGTINIKKYGTVGISATSYLSIGNSDNHGFLAITTNNEATALDIAGTKTKDPHGSSYKVNGVEKNF